MKSLSNIDDDLDDYENWTDEKAYQLIYDDLRESNDLLTVKQLKNWWQVQRLKLDIGTCMRDMDEVIESVLGINSYKKRNKTMTFEQFCDIMEGFETYLVCSPTLSENLLNTMKVEEDREVKNYNETENDIMFMEMYSLSKDSSIGHVTVESFQEAECVQEFMLATPLEQEQLNQIIDDIMGEKSSKKGSTIISFKQYKAILMRCIERSTRSEYKSNLSEEDTLRLNYDKIKGDHEEATLQDFFTSDLVKMLLHSKVITPNQLILVAEHMVYNEDHEVLEHPVAVTLTYKQFKKMIKTIQSHANSTDNIEKEAFIPWYHDVISVEVMLDTMYDTLYRAGKEGYETQKFIEFFIEKMKVNLGVEAINSVFKEVLGSNCVNTSTGVTALPSKLNETQWYDVMRKLDALDAAHNMRFVWETYCEKRGIKIPNEPRDNYFHDDIPNSNSNGYDDDNEEQSKKMQPVRRNYTSTELDEALSISPNEIATLYHTIRGDKPDLSINNLRSWPIIGALIRGHHITSAKLDELIDSIFKKKVAKYRKVHLRLEHFTQLIQLLKDAKAKHDYEQQQMKLVDSVYPTPTPRALGFFFEHNLSYSNFLECRLLSLARIDGEEYGIGYPIDFRCALLYFEDGYIKELKPPSDNFGDNCSTFFYLESLLINRGIVLVRSRLGMTYVVEREFVEDDMNVLYPRYTVDAIKPWENWTISEIIERERRDILQSGEMDEPDDEYTDYYSDGTPIPFDNSTTWRDTLDDDRNSDRHDDDGNPEDDEYQDADDRPEDYEDHRHSKDPHPGLEDILPNVTATMDDLPEIQRVTEVDAYSFRLTEKLAARVFSRFANLKMITSFYHEKRTYHLVRLFDPEFVIGKRRHMEHERKVNSAFDYFDVLPDEEVDKIIPKIDKFFLNSSTVESLIAAHARRVNTKYPEVNVTSPQSRYKQFMANEASSPSESTRLHLKPSYSNTKKYNETRKRSVEGGFKSAKKDWYASKAATDKKRPSKHRH